MSTQAMVSGNHSRDRSFWSHHRWLILRRISQLGILGLFLLGPAAGIWIIEGSLNSSLLLDTVPLSDPFILIQSALAGHPMGSQAVLGGAIIAGFYFLVGGRVFCSWVCPINIITDAAHWLRKRLGLKGRTRIKRSLRFWLLGASLVLSMIGGYIAWELINPVSVLFRGLLFGMGTGWLLIVAVFILDLAVSERAWCGHLCPVGSFYSLLGRYSPVRIIADKRQACDRCMDCFDTCPEPQVLAPVLFSEDKDAGPVIKDAQCTNCGRCIDRCGLDVFRFGLRHSNKHSPDQHSPDRLVVNRSIPITNKTVQHKEA